MKKTFQAVKRGDIDEVRRILEKKPEEVYAVAKQPPKSDDGQSLLQVALKNAQVEIANLLLDYHADVNFMEAEDCCNAWRAPVLHDAIRSAVFQTRWSTWDSFHKYETGETRYIVRYTAEDADAAFGVLKRMIDMGADVSAEDSYGNSCLKRAILDARQVLPRFNHGDKTVSDDRVITEELRFDLRRIFGLLFANGADVNEICKISGKTLKENYAPEPVAEFLTEV